MPLPDSLSQQLELYGQQSEQLETWKAAHTEAMLCRDVEDAACLGLAVLANLRRRTENWKQIVEDRPTSFSWQQWDELAAGYREWCRATALLIEGIEVCEKHGYRIEGHDTLRQAFHETSLMPLDTDRVRRSIESLETGRGTPAEQAMDGLRDRLRQRLAGQS
jgi:hypothetical protein